MRSLDTKASLLWGLWAVALAVSATLLWHEDRFFAASGTSVARVTQTTRDVTYRSEDDVRWKAIGGTSQPVFDGDKLATGPSSSAIIDFGDGRAANLGADTSLTVTTIRQSSGTTYILGLAKGSVGIEKSKPSNLKVKARFPIIVRTGGRDYQIEPGEEKGIIRDDKGVSEFVGKRRSTKSSGQEEKNDLEPATKVDISAAIVANLIAENSATDPDQKATQDASSRLIEVPQSVTKPSKNPVSSVKAPQIGTLKTPKPTGSEVELDAAALSREYYTFQSITTVEGDLGTLKWREPTVLQEGVEWAPALEIRSGPNRKEMALTRGGAQLLRIQDLGQLSASKEKDGLPCALVEMRGGAKVSVLGQKPAWSFAGQTLEIWICSYKDAVEKLPLVVGIGSLDATSPPKPKIFRKPNASGVTVQMVVTTPSQFATLQPILARNESFRVATSQGLAASGIFIGKFGKVVMQLGGSGLTARKADQIRELIGGDVVFKGGRDALLDAGRLTADELKNLVLKNSEQGRTVYMQKGSMLMPVSRKFLEESPEVESFVKSTASRIFTEKVAIISYQ